MLRKQKQKQIANIFKTEYLKQTLPWIYEAVYEKPELTDDGRTIHGSSSDRGKHS